MCVCMCVCLVSQSWQVLCDSKDCSPLGSSAHWTLQARILEWGAIFYSSKTLCMYQKMFRSAQSLSRVQLFAIPWTRAHQASLSITTPVAHKHMSIKSVMPSDHLILCCPCLLLPSVFSSIRVFSNESVLRIRWPKYWSFSFSINPSNEYSGLISWLISCNSFKMMLLCEWWKMKQHSERARQQDKWRDLDFIMSVMD